MRENGEGSQTLMPGLPEWRKEGIQGGEEGWTLRPYSAVTSKRSLAEPWA